MNQAVSSTRILWLKVWGLAAVQGAISLTWIIYHLYLPKLLGQYGFSAVFVTRLLIVETILAAVMEPLMGALSDRVQHWIGSRFPFIALGIILASAGFIAIPTVLVFGGPNGGGRWIMPIVLVLWAFTMTLFRSPALSLLGRYAFATDLPQAASILTLVGGVMGAMNPLASDFILRMGPLATFALGSMILLGAAMALRLVGPDQGLTLSKVPQRHKDKGQPPRALRWDRLTAHLKKLGLIFGTGVAATLGFRLMMRVIPQSLPSAASSGTTKALVATIFIVLAVTAIPIGKLATQLGVRWALILGLGTLSFGCMGLAIAQSQSTMLFVLVILLGTALSLVFNTTVPFALSMVSAQRAGLGTGLFFGGGAIAASIAASLTPWLTRLSNGWEALLGAGAYAIAAGCVILSRKYLP